MLRIGLIQLSVMEGRCQENMEHIKELVEKYAKNNVDLLCFPELCISGYDFEAAAHSVDEAEFFSGLARKYRVAIAAGINVVREGRHYDVACIFDETGALLGEYRKIHLWDKECDFFEPGDSLLIIPFKGWKIGLLICADMRFFEISTPLKNMGADVIIYPSAWIAGWKALLHLCARMRAAENQIYTIALNRASGDVDYCGGTALMGPDGSIQNILDHDREAYMDVVLEKSQIQAARDALEWESLKFPGIYKKYDQYRFME